MLVENPGYYNLFGLLHGSGLRLRAVPRTPAGPDLEALEALLRAGEAPKLFFMQTLLHNPTGSDLGPASAHRLLRLAEQYGFLIVEDDAYADLAEDSDLRLAALDLDRVIYLSGFTKTLSASLRVGYAAASGPVIEALTRVKLLTCIASPEFAERVVHALANPALCAEMGVEARGRVLNGFRTADMVQGYRDTYTVLAGYPL